MVQRLDYKPPASTALLRRARAQKYMTKTPAELLDLVQSGDPVEGTTAVQETRRMLVFCVMAIRGLIRE